MTAGHLTQLHAVTARWAPGWRIGMEEGNRLFPDLHVDETIACISHARWGDWPCLVLWRDGNRFCSGVIELDGLGNDVVTVLDTHPNIPDAVARLRAWVDAYRDV